MTSRFRTIGLAVAGIALAIAAVSVSAQRGPGQPGDRGRGGRGPRGFGPPMGLAIERMDRELSFTDAQRSEIQSLLSAERTTFQGAMSEMRTAQQAVENSIMQVPADEGLIEANINAVSAVQTRLAAAHAKTEAKIFALLTADQQQKVRQFVADRSSRRPKQ